MLPISSWTFTVYFVLISFSAHILASPPDDTNTNIVLPPDNSTSSTGPSSASGIATTTSATSGVISSSNSVSTATSNNPTSTSTSDPNPNPNPNSWLPTSISRHSNLTLPADTRIAKLQLNYNTSLCLSAILDPDSYAQPELTLRPNCSEESTNWLILPNTTLEGGGGGQIICGDCEDWPVLDGGSWGKTPNATMLNEQKDGGNGLSWIIGQDKRIQLANSGDEQTGTPKLCLSEGRDDTGGSYIRSEYCGSGLDSFGSKVNQIWNLTEDYPLPP